MLRKSVGSVGLRARKTLFVGVVAVAGSLAGVSSASAQCRDNFNFAGSIVLDPVSGARRLVPISQFMPLGTGSSLSALTSTINTLNTAFLTQTTAFVSAPGNPAPNQQGAGAWGRVIAGTIETKQSSTGTLDLSAVGETATGTQTCNTKTQQDYWGYQVGHDISVLNGGATGANWHFGVTAGYLEAKTVDKTPAGSFFNPNLVGVFPGVGFFDGNFGTAAGSFSEDSQVPFFGVYTAFTKGGFALDGQARWDFHQGSLSDRNNGLFDQRLDAQGFSLTGNALYNIQLGGGWFLEPSTGVVFSRVSIDPLNVSGVPTPTNVVARGSVRIDDIESVLGRATVRVGTNFTGGGMAWQPFVTASVFHEFKGDVTATSMISDTNNANIDGWRLNLQSEGGIGTYGQFAVGTAAAILNTGWLGYARVDYRTGENVEGWSVNAGLRYQFTPGQAASTKDGPIPVVYSYNWSGPYIGVYGGTYWGQESWRFSNGANVSPNFAGAEGGGQVGYNIQVGNSVFGASKVITGLPMLAAGHPARMVLLYLRGRRRAAGDAHRKGRCNLGTSTVLRQGRLGCRRGLGGRCGQSGDDGCAIWVPNDHQSYSWPEDIGLAVRLDFRWRNGVCTHRSVVSEGRIHVLRPGGTPTDLRRRYGNRSRPRRQHQCRSASTSISTLCSEKL